MTATIVTVTHKSGDHISDYVTSFIDQHHDRFTDQIAFVVVENSGDTTMGERLQPLRDVGYSTKLLTMENRGFGAACNLGARATASDVLLFVNPDVTFIEPLRNVELLSGRWGTGRQLDQQGRLFSFDILPEHKTLLSELTKLHLSMTPPPAGWEHRVFPVGALFCVDRAIFLNVGGFDERFFLYHEEAELARRLQKAVGPPSFFQELAILHHQFGSECNREATSVHELNGLITYAAATGIRSVLLKRLILLLVTSPFRATSRQRLKQFASWMLR